MNGSAEYAIRQKECLIFQVRQRYLTLSILKACLLSKFCRSSFDAVLMIWCFSMFLILNFVLYIKYMPIWENCIFTHLFSAKFLHYLLVYLQLISFTCICAYLYVCQYEHTISYTEECLQCKLNSKTIIDNHRDCFANKQLRMTFRV